MYEDAFVRCPSQRARPVLSRTPCSFRTSGRVVGIRFFWPIVFRCAPPSARVPELGRSARLTQTSANLCRERGGERVVSTPRMRHPTLGGRLTNCSLVVRHGAARCGIEWHGRLFLHSLQPACMTRVGTRWHGTGAFRSPVTGQWGCRGRRFESSRPDHFQRIVEARLTPPAHPLDRCGPPGSWAGARRDRQSNSLSVIPDWRVG